MKIAIHSHKESFSERWINYCEKNDIPFKIVNCYETDIIEQLNDCDALMWHHHHTEYKDVLLAKNLLFSLEQSGKIVFPDFNTGWHFDDKVAQKYLLESINAPLVPSYVFYDKQSAKEWISSVKFPKVFKLKGGSGSRNVRLIKNEKHAITLINKAFGKGFSQSSRWQGLKERARKVKEGKQSISHFIKGIGRLLIPTEYDRMRGKEKGYVYFQDFIPENDFDIRIIVVKNKAFGIKRTVRKGDFRASGSGNFIYDRMQFDLRCISIAFNVSEKLRSQCIAYDFVFDKQNNPLIVEISYGFSVPAYDDCEGFWDSDLNWHEGQFNPQEWMIEDVLKNIRAKNE